MKFLKNLSKTILIFSSIFFLSISSVISEEGTRESKMPKYKITPHDSLRISIYPQSDLNTTLEVDENGFIFFSFLGYIKVAGLTTKELEEKLTKLLEEDYLVDPLVIVKIEESKENVVIVMGEVARPGTYKYKLTGMTLMEIISEAGGFTDIAWINGTRIIRSIEGEEKTLKVKVGNILNAKEKDVLIKPGDIIVVPESIF